MSRYRLSSGVFISKSLIDNKIRKAKELKLAEHYDIYGRYVCTKCFRNDCLPITVSHIISVNDCQRNGKTEMAWDLNNLQIYGMKCHAIFDGLDLRFSK